MRPDLFLDAKNSKQFSDGLFRMIFGRRPNLKRDRSFLINYLTSIQKTREDIIELYLKRGITKQQLAAIYQTGIAPTRSNFRKYPSRLVREWIRIAAEPTSAIQIDERLTPHISTDFVGEAAATLYLEVSNSVIRICHLLETGARSAHSSDVGILFLYILARAAELLRSIRILNNNDEGTSILALLRGLYECFGRLLFVNRRPELAVTLIFPAMTDGVRFEYCKNKLGRRERRKVREIKTGREYRVDYSLPEIFSICDADRDAAIHSEFYLTLSAEVHPTSELLFEFVKKQGFLLHRSEDALFVMHMAGYVLFLVWREISVFPLLSKRDRRDAQYALQAIRDAMLTIVENLKPVVVKRETGAFEKTFLGICESLAEPYNDKFWRTSLG